MAIFCFLIECEATSGTPRAADIAGAQAEVWVVADSLADAQIKARSHLLDYAWLPKTVERAFQPTPEQIALLDAQSRALHRKAILQSVASAFLAWPKIAGADDDPIETRSLGEPPIPGNRQ